MAGYLRYSPWGDKPRSMLERVQEQLHENGFVALEEAGGPQIRMQHGSRGVSLDVWEVGWDAAVSHDKLDDIEKRAFDAVPMSFLDALMGG